MARLVEIARFPDPEAAHCARALLESDGVFAILHNEHHIAADPAMRVALNGVGLFCLDAEAADAQSLLASAAPSDAGEEPTPGRKRNWLWLLLSVYGEAPFVPVYRRKTVFAGQTLIAAMIAAVIVSAFLAGRVWP